MDIETMAVLRREPDLASGLPGGARKRAFQECVADVKRIQRGDWDAQSSGLDPGGFGLLLSAGYLLRRVGQGGRFGAELLGPGDLVRPWLVASEGESLPAEPHWTAITPVEAAVLDLEFAQHAAPFPAVAIQLVDRAMLRSRNMAIAMAIVHQPRIDRRLHMLLWHYADRWGTVSASGTAVDVPLTHGTLAELVGARRPSVSTALGKLADESKVRRAKDRWLLLGGPPGELEELPSTIRSSSSRSAAADVVSERSAK
jgi:CRP/FNR family transcriptional regulator, cyclic AMP receptor protein